MYIPIVFPRSFEDGAIFEATALAAGKKDDLAIARRMLMGNSQTYVGAKKYRRNEIPVIARAIVSMRHLPILSAIIPKGTLKIMEQMEEMDIIKPNMSVEASRSWTTYSGKMGDMRNVIQYVNETKTRRYKMLLELARSIGIA
jgi:hypothetical protein